MHLLLLKNAEERRELGHAAIAERANTPDPMDDQCQGDMAIYMHDCRRLLALGVKRWEGPAPGRLGPRVLNPDDPEDYALIKRMFSSPPKVRLQEAEDPETKSTDAEPDASGSVALALTPLSSVSPDCAGRAGSGNQGGEGTPAAKRAQ